MSQVHLNVPLLVMDGAGVYDAGEGEYFHTEPITQEDSMRLRALKDRNDLLDGEVYHASEIVYFKIVGNDGLYIYTGNATMEHARKWLMTRIWKENLRIMPREFSLHRGCQSEHEALNLLHRVENDYEPIWFWQGVSSEEGK